VPPRALLPHDVGDEEQCSTRSATRNSDVDGPNLKRQQIRPGHCCRTQQTSIAIPGTHWSISCRRSNPLQQLNASSVASRTGGANRSPGDSGGARLDAATSPCSYEIGQSSTVVRLPRVPAIPAGQALSIQRVTGHGSGTFYRLNISR